VKSEGVGEDWDGVRTMLARIWGMSELGSSATMGGEDAMDESQRRSLGEVSTASHVRSWWVGTL
jgi:hypothetical protein